MPLRLKKRHGSPNWYLRGTVGGEEVDETTGTPDKKEAEEICAKREVEIRARKRGGRRAVATFVDAALSYLENGGEARYVKPLADHFGSTLLAEIGQAEAEDCARKLLPEAGPATRNRQIFTPMSAILTHAAKRKLCDRPIFERPTQPRGRVRWLTIEEADSLIAACSPHLAPLVTFMFFTGCRVSEALNLDWRDVDLSRAHVVFGADVPTKNGDRRGVPLHPRAVAALANLPHRVGGVFRRPDGKAYVEKDDGGGQIKTAFRGACRRAGITNFHPHDCRHTWATWHYAANRDPAALMELGGWRTPSMVFRYAHVNASDLAPGIMRLGENPGTADMGIPMTLRKQRDSA